MRDITTLHSDKNQIKNIAKFNRFLHEYGHEVFLRILSKSMLIAFTFMILSAIVASKTGSNDIMIITFIVFLITIFAYITGTSLSSVYTWIYQIAIYSISSFLMLQIFLFNIVDLDFKIVVVFFIFLFSIAIKNPFAHLLAVLINYFIGFIYFKYNNLMPFLNVNDHFTIFIITFSVIFMNFRNYKALKSEFFEDQKYLAKSTLISSIGNRYEVDSFKNMVEESAINESLYKYKLFFDKTFNLYMIFDADGIYEINDGLLKVFGITREDFKLKKLEELIDFDEVIKKSNSFDNSNQKIMIEDRVIFINSVVTKIKFEGKELYMLSGYDNTINVMLNKKMEKSLELREKIVELSRVIIEEDTICETLSRIIDMTVSVISNASYGSVLIYDEKTGYLNIECFRGYESEIISDFKIKLEDSYIYNLTNGKLDKSVLSKNLGSSSLVKVENVLNNDNQIVINSTISSPLYLNGKFFGAVCVDSSGDKTFEKSDVESLEYIRNQIEIALGKKMIFEEVRKLSNTDVLTGAFNRRYFESTILPMLDNEKHDIYHFVVIDLDNLKIVNDTYGHAFGDLYIQGFVKNLRKFMRCEDYIVRSGGDEFTLTFKHLSIQLLKERLFKIENELSKNPLVNGVENVFIKFSYGIASYPVDGKDKKELLMIADDKMYKMKKENR